MIKYKTIEDFRSSLRKIVPSVVTEGESTETDFQTDQQRVDTSALAVEDGGEDGDYDEDKDNEQLDTKTQAWFREIQGSDQAQKAAKRIQDWFRKAYERRQKYQKFARDQIQDKIYNDIRDFCCNSSNWEVAINQKGEKELRKYHMLLKGSMVDVIVEMNKLQDTMDKIKNKLQKIINNRSTDSEKLESCLNLEDDLKFVYRSFIHLKFSVNVSFYHLKLIKTLLNFFFLGIFIMMRLNQC